jgi:hypothetical protein
MPDSAQIISAETTSSSAIEADPQCALAGLIEQSTGERGDAELDVTRGRRDRDRLRGIEELELDVEPLVAEIAALESDEHRTGGGEPQDADTQPFLRACRLHCRSSGCHGKARQRLPARRKPHHSSRGCFQSIGLHFTASATQTPEIIRQGAAMELRRAKAATSS